MPAVERFFEFSLLGLIASGYLAIAGSGYVDIPTIVLAGIGMLWRAAIVSGMTRFEVPERVVTIATIVYMVFAPIDYFLLSRTWISATVHVVFFVATVKTLTARTARDYLFVAAVAFIEILAAALFSSSGTFFFCLVLYLLCAVAALASSEVRSLGRGDFLIARVPHRAVPPRLLGVATFMTAGILVLTAGLFFLLPRTASAALRFLNSNRYHLTGFSNDVTLGEVGELKSDSRAVMHVRAYGEELPANLKWRGLALERFDGHRWSTNPSSFEQSSPERNGLIRVADDWQRRRTGHRVTYRVVIQNVDADALFIAGVPEFLNLGQTKLLRSPSGSFRVGFVPSDTLMYEVNSSIGPPEARPSEPRVWRLTASEREQNLRLPRVDPRIAPLALELTRGARSEAERVHMLEQNLRKRYGYSLELPEHEPVDPVANFLFERKQGYCEYFASAMTIMLRSLGVPARLVNGFQSGITNPYSGMLVIRASDAHTWVEAFLPDTGWTVFDPTPFAAVSSRNSIWTRLNLYVDAADTFWREWVLSYDIGQQITLASRIEMQTRRFRSSGTGMGLDWLKSFVTDGLLNNAWRWGRPILLILVMAVTAFLTLRWLRDGQPSSRARAGRSRPGDATLLYQRMLKLMRRRGYQKPSWLTPREFATNVRGARGEELERFTAAYYAVRFGGQNEVARDMAAALERLARSGD